LRAERRVARVVAGSGDGSGRGSSEVEREDWRRALAPVLTVQPWPEGEGASDVEVRGDGSGGSRGRGEISTNWASGLLRSRRIWSGAKAGPREATRRKVRRRWLSGSQEARASRWVRMREKAWADGVRLRWWVQAA